MPCKLIWRPENVLSDDYPLETRESEFSGVFAESLTRKVCISSDYNIIFFSPRSHRLTKTSNYWLKPVVDLLIDISDTFDLVFLTAVGWILLLTRILLIITCTQLFYSPIIISEACGRAHSVNETMIGSWLMSGRNWNVSMLLTCPVWQHGL